MYNVEYIKKIHNGKLMTQFLHTHCDISEATIQVSEVTFCVPNELFFGMTVHIG